jgi:hypothetical protein
MAGDNDEHYIWTSENFIGTRGPARWAMNERTGDFIEKISSSNTRDFAHIIFVRGNAEL